jgi:hydrogenase-4 component B
MAHTGGALILLALFILGRNADAWSFSSFSVAPGHMDAWEQAAVFFLALVGFGTKAGLIPFHIWRPRAYAVLPEHVTALMSAAVAKVALYGLVRVVLEWAGPLPTWAGAVLIGIGAVSAVIGILYALMEHDLVRVLANSTIEQIGLIAIGLGAAAILQREGHESGAALALAASLIHLLNHSIFKSLLFLGAGAVDSGAGLRDLDRLGGLVRTMPRTTALVLIGGASAAALPPLNGFAGEWLLFQGMLNLGSASSSTAIGTLAAAGAAVLAFTGALGVVCFVRVIGIGFLGVARSDRAREAKEVGRSMQLAMLLLAGAVILLGVFPKLLVRLVEPVTLDLTGQTGQFGFGYASLTNPHIDLGRYAPLPVIAGFVAIGILPWAIARLTAGPLRTRVAPPWFCGFAFETRMQYTATSFTKVLRLVFKAVLRPENEPSAKVDKGETGLAVPVITYRAYLDPVVEQQGYRRVVDGMILISRRALRLQGGSTRLYLAYFFVTLIVLLMIAR